jgi:hypothetical protein
MTVGICAFWGLGLSMAQAEDDLRDARVILDAKNGTIKKWAHAPRFVVVHDRPVNRPAIADTIAFIKSATGLAIAEPSYVDLTEARLDERFYSSSHYEPQRRDSGMYETTLSIAAQEEIAVAGSMFVFMVAPRYASHLMVLSGFGRSSQGLERNYHRSPNHCFFNVMSVSRSIQFGRIVISPEQDMAEQAACIYEEMTQSMGLMQDAHDSAYFTYDNLADEKPRGYDERLLAALYHPSVATGDAVNKVLDIYAAPR